MSDKRDAHARAQQELINEMEKLGYPGEFGEVIAGELKTESAMRRMASYLRSAHPSSFEEIADHAIMLGEQRDRWMEHKKSAYYQAKITAFYNYNRPRVDDDEQ